MWLQLRTLVYFSALLRQLVCRGGSRGGGAMSAWSKACSIVQHVAEELYPRTLAYVSALLRQLDCRGGGRGGGAMSVMVGAGSQLRTLAYLSVRLGQLDCRGGIRGGGAKSVRPRPCSIVRHVAEEFQLRTLAYLSALLRQLDCPCGSRGGGALGGLGLALLRGTPSRLVL